MLQVWNDVQSGLSDNSKVFDCKIIFSHAILDRSQPFLIRTSGKYHSQAGTTNPIHKSVCFDNFNIGQAYGTLIHICILWQNGPRLFHWLPHILGIYMSGVTDPGIIQLLRNDLLCCVHLVFVLCGR